ncbi:MAG: hypothetical protein HC800_16190 [Phormidesmis sp. RL_2_1]|nr:hypothetical protein [Phormidesmis sp. RL_2_1]
MSVLHPLLRPVSRALVPVVFVPAGLGLLLHSITAATVAERLLALALAIFCPELARMAFVDISNTAAVLQQSEQTPQDSRLSHFLGVVASTIVLEIMGFYGSLFSLPWGAIAIIFSQIWFNLLAGIQLAPGETPAIVTFGISQRRAVLVANGLGLGLMGLWTFQENRIWLASGLLLLVILFLVIKYAVATKPPHKLSS